MRLNIPEINLRGPEQADLQFLKTEQIQYETFPVFTGIAISEQIINISDSAAETFMDILHMYTDSDIWLKRIDKGNYTLVMKENENIED